MRITRAALAESHRPLTPEGIPARGSNDDDLLGWLVVSPPPAVADPYLLAWEKIRQGEKRAMMGLAGLVVTMLVGTWILRSVSLSPAMFRLVLVAPILAGSLGLMAYRGTFRCPKCGFRILTRGVGSKSGFSQGACGNCGIRVGTPKNAGGLPPTST